jgi:glucose-6-phosphate isomerase
MRFVGNIDPADLSEALHGLDPAQTLVIVASKSFGTQETMANARDARSWILAAAGGEPSAVAKHFVALTTNAAAAAAFGVAEQNILPLWDWVGGRFSCASSIGLSTMLSIGPTRFEELLAGFRVIDEHFCTTPLERNLPVLLGGLRVWSASLVGAGSYAVVPYAEYLAELPAYLQQLEMESNGKSVDRQGRRVETRTCPVVWGTAGTGGQHAYFQLLHQGTERIPTDFIGFARPCQGQEGSFAKHEQLLANMLGQSRALAFGRTAEELRAAGVPDNQLAHRTTHGDRPSTTILADQLTPHTLGQLLALYEHTTFVAGALWNVNSFDQWGVELGKDVAAEVYAHLTADDPPSSRHPLRDDLDESTRRLVAQAASWRDARMRGRAAT